MATKPTPELLARRAKVAKDDAALAMLTYSVRPTTDRPGVDLATSPEKGLPLERGRLTPRGVRDLVSDLLMMVEISYQDQQNEREAARYREAKLFIRSLLPRDRQDDE